LTDRELEAHRKYPTTFFGAVDENAKRKCETIFDWYGRTPKEKLLDFMKDANDITELKKIVTGGACKGILRTDGTGPAQITPAFPAGENVGREGALLRPVVQPKP
jgi:hypothetical protein